MYTLTCVGKQRMIVRVIVELGPHAQSELLQVWQIDFVVDVL